MAGGLMEWVFLVWMLCYPITVTTTKVMCYITGYYDWLFDGKDKTGVMAIGSFIEALIYIFIARLIWYKI